MTVVEMKIDSVRHAEFNGKWVTILKRKDADEYFPICMNASQANIIKRELIPGRFGDSYGYEQFLVGEDITGYDLKSVIIDEPDGNVRARLVFRKGNSTLKIQCPVAGAIALAYRKNAEIFTEKCSFYNTSVVG